MSEFSEKFWLDNGAKIIAEKIIQEKGNQSINTIYNYVEIVFEDSGLTSWEHEQVILTMNTVRKVLKSRRYGFESF